MGSSTQAGFPVSGPAGSFRAAQSSTRGGLYPQNLMPAVRIPHSPPRPWTPSSADAAPTSTAKEPEPEPEQRVPAAKATADGEVKVIQLDPTSRLYGSKLPSAAAMFFFDLEI